MQLYYWERSEKSNRIHIYRGHEVLGSFSYRLNDAQADAMVTALNVEQLEKERENVDA